MEELEEQGILDAYPNNTVTIKIIVTQNMQPLGWIDFGNDAENPEYTLLVNYIPD